MLSFPNIPGLTPVVGLLAVIAISGFVALVKVWPTLKRLSMDENERLRLDRREDYKELRIELDMMKLRNTIVERHCTAVDVRMGQLEFIIGLTLDELEAVSPGNQVAKRSREMFGRLYPVSPITPELEAMKRQLDPLQSPIAGEAA